MTPTPYKEVECKDCEKGQHFCMARPCWALPQQVLWMLEHDVGVDKLMLDWWQDEAAGGPVVEIVSPAIVGREGKAAPMFPVGKCVFLGWRDLKCGLHGIQKPFEGAVVCCKGQTDEWKVELHFWVARQWDSEVGRKVVEMWKERMGVESPGNE